MKLWKPLTHKSFRMNFLAFLVSMSKVLRSKSKFVISDAGKWTLGQIMVFWMGFKKKSEQP